jgi:hypothetical protein
MAQLTPAAEIRKAARELCEDCMSADHISDYMECYFRVRDHLGLTRSTKARDVGLVAGELTRMKKEAL